jgi:hypothetical protein
VDPSNDSGRHKVTAQTGDVDLDGELVDRLRAAIGEYVADDIDPSEQVALARWLAYGGHDLHSVRVAVLERRLP